MSQALEIFAGERKITSASIVNSGIPADLDFIVRKALRREPIERYASADPFASDIHAFLEYGPVKARSVNAWYRARKFLRRYWVPVGAAALVITSLTTGLFIANQRRYMANRQREIAERRFAQVRQLAKKVLALDDMTILTKSLIPLKRFDITSH